MGSCQTSRLRNFDRPPPPASAPWFHRCGHRKCDSKTARVVDQEDLSNRMDLFGCKRLWRRSARVPLGLWRVSLRWTNWVGRIQRQSAASCSFFTWTRTLDVLPLREYWINVLSIFVKMQDAIKKGRAFRVQVEVEAARVIRSPRPSVAPFPEAFFAK